MGEGSSNSFRTYEDKVKGAYQKFHLDRSNFNGAIIQNQTSKQLPMLLKTTHKCITYL